MSFKYEHNATRDAFSMTIALNMATQVAIFVPPKSHLALLTNAFIPGS
jgi:hypothetical protein